MTIEQYYARQEADHELLQETARMVREIHTAVTGGEYVTVDDIAAAEHRSRDHIYRHPWLMPENGVSPFGARNKKWAREDWDAWRQIPESERKIRYYNAKKAPLAS